ncbi:MAG: aldo/keto reductase [Clostridiales bacterium]|nr:aldo/keto reductase [Clostridiales bacterium]
MSALGFGAMRLPMVEMNGQREVDEEKAIPVIHRAFELGVNYIDTAPYYCEKQSEIAVGKALKSWSGKVYLSTKNPIEDASGDHFRDRLERSLKNLGVESIDFYHMWGISLDSFKNRIMAPGGPMEAAIKAKNERLIKHVSFSYHDKPENFREIVDSGLFESVLMQYNLLDRSNEENIDYANEHGLGVVIMGPVGGGRLGAPSPVIMELLGGKAKSSAETALRFVLSNKNVNIALSGMNTIAMVEENAEIASISGHLKEDEKAKVLEMMAENKRLSELYCTGCNYCQPCPQEIKIPLVFNLMNYHRVYQITGYAKDEYKKLVDGTGWDKSKLAPDCIECGQCEGKCPQHLEIIKQLKETHAALT